MYIYETNCIFAANKYDMPHRQITYDNFYTNTFAVFKACKRPLRKSDYVSRDCERGYISSEYWYGKDSVGEYVIRCSDHWASRNNKIDCRNVASCIWELFVPKQSQAKLSSTINCTRKDNMYCGKAYLSWFKPRN